MDAQSIQRVRSFNRTVAERVGVFGDRFLGRARPYGESRVLWEIGADAIEIRALPSTRYVMPSPFAPSSSAILCGV